MKHDLRPYQTTALDSIYSSFKDEPLFLFQGITGCGKTLIICRLINQYVDKRCLILVNKQELVKQFHSTLVSQTDVSDIGICCSSLNKFNLSSRVVIATVQTFVNRIKDYAGCDLLVIDEAHRAGFGNGSQYDRVVSALHDQMPNMRVLGTSSTPSRLGHGYIYGDKCVKGGVNLFKKVGHQIKYQVMKDQGYLVELQGKVAHADSLMDDLAGVKVNGDYVLNELGEIMSKEIHLRTAADAIREHCMDYKHIAVFCCTIDHAIRVQALLGDDCTIIHSNLSPLERQINMADWTSGRKKICTSINILAEGFDFPPLDCLVFARPTLSSVLFLQAVGRSLRIADGKDHAFMLDLTDNTARFGTDIDNVRVTIPKSVTKKILDDDPLIKLCPMCEREVFVSLRVCPDCGFEWPVAEIIEANHVPELKEVKFQPKERELPKWYDVHDMFVEMHESRKNGKFLGRIEFECGLFRANMWLCFSDFYSGYAVTKAREKWEMLVGYAPFPEGVDEFMECQTLVKPKRILVTVDTEYPDILEFEFEKTPFDDDFMEQDVLNVFDGEMLDDDELPF